MNIEQAKQIPLEDILDFFGHQPVRQSAGQFWYCSPLREEHTPSFKVNPSLNLWYDFGDGRHGDSIDLVTEMKSLGNVSEALAQLDQIGHSPGPRVKKSPQPAASPRDKRSAMELTAIGPVKAKSLLHYLKKRGINPAVVGPLVQEAHYRVNDRPYFALAFANDSGGLELRNPYFKGTLGSKDISTISGQGGRVYVFEGMFDYFTALEMFPCGLNGTAIILNSASMKEKAIEAIRKMNPSVVEIYPDDDQAGQQLLAAFEDALPETTIIDWSDLYRDSGHRDLNEWYVQVRHATLSRTAG